MKNYRVIFESEDKNYRIVEIPDECAELAELKGDCFNPKYITDIDPEKLKEKEKQFEDRVSREGVFGYSLEKWDPKPNGGWTHVDSCFGFVGQYTPTETTFNHYIVDELKSQIPKKDLNSFQIHLCGGDKKDCKDVMIKAIDSLEAEKLALEENPDFEAARDVTDES